MREIIPWQKEDNRREFEHCDEEFLIAAFPEENAPPRNNCICIFTKVSWSWKFGGTGWVWIPLTSNELIKKSHSCINDIKFNTLNKDYCRVYAFDSYDEFLDYCVKFRKK